MASHLLARTHNYASSIYTAPIAFTELEAASYSVGTSVYLGECS